MQGKALLLMVDDSGAGQMIVDGRCYTVRSSWTQAGAGVGGLNGYRPHWTVNITAEKSLDEEAQRLRIAGLEAELSRERERLDDIRVVFMGGTEAPS
jgi:hypothetical protein